MKTSNQGEEPQRRKSSRVSVPSIKYPSSNYMTIIENGELENFNEIVSHKEKDMWMKVVQEEMKSLHISKLMSWFTFQRGRSI